MGGEGALFVLLCVCWGRGRAGADCCTCYIHTLFVCASYLDVLYRLFQLVSSVDLWSLIASFVVYIYLLSRGELVHGPTIRLNVILWVDNY